MEVCASEGVVGDSVVEIGGRVESANGFIVCPDGFETGFVEGGVGFAEAVIVFVIWGFGISGGEVEGVGLGLGLFFFYFGVLGPAGGGAVGGRRGGRGGIESFGIGDLLGDSLEGNWRFGCCCRCGLWAPLSLRFRC